MTRRATANLFLIAQEEVASGKVGGTVGDESHLLIVGSRGSGKSSIMMRFLDRTETPKPTTALEYTFGRRAKTHTATVKDVAHVWELGGGSSETALLSVPLQPTTLTATTAMIVVDLGKPETIWVSIEKLVGEVRLTAEKAAKAAPQEVRDKTEAAKKERLSRVDVAERPSIDAFPLPLLIVGGRHDVFAELESEKRKIVARTLRFLAHANGASLVFFSDKTKSLVDRVRSMMSHHVFGTTEPKNLVTDHNQPLLIPFGKDTFEGIGNPPLAEGDLGRLQAKSPAELWKYAFNRFFPGSGAAGDDVFTVPPDPTTADPFFQEKLIDEQREKMEAEIERYRKEAEKRAHRGEGDK